MFSFFPIRKVFGAMSVCVRHYVRIAHTHWHINTRPLLLNRSYPHKISNQQLFRKHTTRRFVSAMRFLCFPLSTCGFFLVHWQIACLYNADWFYFFNILPTHLLHYLVALMNSYTSAHTYTTHTCLGCNSHRNNHSAPLGFCSFILRSTFSRSTNKHTYTHKGTRMHVHKCQILLHFVSNRCALHVCAHPAASSSSSSLQL